MIFLTRYLKGAYPKRQVRFKTTSGFSIADMSMTILLLGVIGFLVIPFIINTKEADPSLAQTREHAAENIAKGFDISRSASGLIPKSQGPSQVIMASLNKTDIIENETNELPEACEDRVALPAKEMTIQGGRLKVYVSNEWTLNSTEGDFTEVCVESVQSKEVTIKYIPREGDQVGLVNNAGGTTMEIARNTGVTTGDLSYEDPTNGGPDNGISTRITPKFISVYTQRDLTQDLRGTTVTATNQATGESFTGSDSIVVGGYGQYTLVVNSFPTFSDRAYTGPSQPVTANVTIGKNAPSIPVEDRYQLTTAIKSPFSNLANVETNRPDLAPGQKGVPIDVTVSFNKVRVVKRRIITEGTTETKTINDIISTSNHNWLIPAGTYQLVISGQDIKTFKSPAVDLASQPRTSNANLSHKMDINILGIGAQVLGPLFRYAAQVTHTNIFNASGANDHAHKNILNSYLGLNGGLFNLVHRTHSLINSFNGANVHPNYYVSVGVRNRETGGLRHNAHSFVSTLRPVPGSNKSLFMGPAPDYQIYRANRLITPVKIQLTPGHAELNSDDYFRLDADGFKQETEDPLLTPGGLNAQEGWLVLDRNHNGTWKDNTLDNDDLFGDHLGRVKNGYVDLHNTFRHELKTDAKGNQYLDLREHTWWGELQLYLSRTFMNDTIPYAAYDLQVFTRDRRLLPARDVLDKVYVSYWDVEEHDSKYLNAIFQRGWVHYPNGEFKQSADQYFAVPSGILEEITGPEADAIREKALKSKH